MSRFRFIKRAIPAVISIIVALFVSLGYLFPDRMTFDYRGQPTAPHTIMIEWAVIIAAFVFLLGAFNIFVVHVNKARQRGGGIHRFHSWMFLLAMLATLTLSILSLRYGPAEGAAVSEPAEEATQWVFDHIINPVGASLAGLLVFTLTLAAFRLLRTRRNAWTILFILAAVIVLATAVPLAGLPLGPFSTVRHWTVDVLGMAGMRGLLLGVALGTMITAVRVLWSRGDS